MSANLYITVKGYQIPIIMVSGGIFKTVEQLRAIAGIEGFHPEWGSITTLQESGNGGNDYFPIYMEVSGIAILIGALNSIGLTNIGMDEAERAAPDLVKLFADNGKALHINLSGKGVSDTLTLIKRALDCGIPLITVNGACPNKPNQPILCDDPEAVDELFERADAEIGVTSSALMWKVSLGMRRPALAHNKQRVATSKAFSGMITGNTIPNGYAFDTNGQSGIRTANGLSRGGVSGPMVRPIALDHTDFCAMDMPDGKFVWGCGGITSATDVSTFVHKANARAVQMNTAYTELGKGRPDFITGMLADYADLVQAA